MSDLVVTLPLSFGLYRWIQEGDPAGEESSGEEWGWYVGGARPACEAGDRLYVVHAGKLRGFAPVIRVATLRPGSHCIVRGGYAVAVTIPERIPGFRGWRRRWWDREAEQPFPEWRTP